MGSLSLLFALLHLSVHSEPRRIARYSVCHLDLIYYTIDMEIVQKYHFNVTRNVYAMFDP
jgi:hypothetical protein